MLLWRALTGDAKLLISHFRDEDLLHWNAGQRIFEVLSQAHKHISEFEDQDDFDNAFYKLHRERNQTLLQFANVARAAYLKHDAYGYPLPDRTKGMIFLRQAKIPGHLEDHIMAKTNGSRNFSDLLDAIQILARRPMSQISSSFPSYYDEWDESTNATEYYDIDNRDDVDNDEYYDEYNEPEDHDNEWIDMSDIPEDATFEEPELACMLESLQKGKKLSGKGFRRGKKGWSKGESRDVSKAGKGGRPENYKQVRWKLQSDRLNRGWKDQPANVTSKGRGRSQLAQVDDLLARTRCFKCGELGHLAKDCPQNKETTTNSETFFSGMVYINSCDVHPRNRLITLVQVLFEAIVLVFLKTILLVFLEVTVPVFLEMILVHAIHETYIVLLMTLETNPRCTLILETIGMLKLTLNKMVKLFLMFVKMM